MMQSNEIILFHYSLSPYARRVFWYLNLRRIPFSQCIQSPILPRPALEALGVSYRRIPLLSIGKDVYVDSRLIIEKLEALYPPSSSHPAIVPVPPAPSTLAFGKLFEIWNTDGGIFDRLTELVPSDAPLLSDEKFTKDREQYSGRSWGKEMQDRLRPDALVEIRHGFSFLEDQVLGDGREWVLGKEGPSLADIHAVWTFQWIVELPGALPPDVISKDQFPKVFAWIARFEDAIRKAVAAHGQTKRLEIEEVLKTVSSASFAEDEVSVEEKDPLGLKKGQLVEVWPTDSGFNNKDRGVLIGLNWNEAVIEIKTRDGHSLRLHAPRHGFKVRAIDEERSSGSSKI
ncbi:hypothetical protein F5884DRAFT_65739 [Xylogone sp. PMI_703]|nr:hypothetical protein F5884DRAFT_65739 [Xylogone sp. PMI_703]